MKTIRNILFPVDFSSSCEAMAPLVKRFASIWSAKVTLLHVLEPSPSGFELLVRPMPEVEKDLEEAARRKLAAFLARDFPANRSSRLLAAGDAANRIAGIARERGFDLIAMPTHAGAFRRTLIGSTTAKILNDADCPVLTTQHAETISPRPLGHREWLCAVGLREDSLRVLRYASAAAGAIGGKLTLVYVIPAGDPRFSPELRLASRLESAEERVARKRINELQKSAGSRAAIEIMKGGVKDSLIEAARKLQADVLFIGRSPQPGSRGRLRDLTYAMVRDAPCPVLSI